MVGPFLVMGGVSGECVVLNVCLCVYVPLSCLV